MFVLVLQDDKINIHVHLISTSYFLFIVALTTVVYGLIKRRIQGDNSSSSPVMSSHTVVSSDRVIYVSSCMGAGRGGGGYKLKFPPPTQNYIHLLEILSGLTWYWEVSVNGARFFSLHFT